MNDNDIYFLGADFGSATEAIETAMTGGRVVVFEENEHHRPRLKMYNFSENEAEEIYDVMKKQLPKGGKTQFFTQKFRRNKG